MRLRLLVPALLLLSSTQALPSSPGSAIQAGGSVSRQSGRSLARVVPVVRSPVKRAAAAAATLGAYCGAAYACVQTSGAPYQAAIAALGGEARVLELLAASREAVGGDGTAASCYPELPPALMPSVAATLLLFAVAVLHALYALGGRWSARWLAATHYRRCPGAAATAALVLPAVREPWVVLAVDADKRAFVHRQRTYTHDADAAADAPEAAQWRSPSPPTDLPLAAYFAAAKSDASPPPDAAAQYGPNRIDVPKPLYREALLESVLSPLSVFNAFSQLLALLEQNWKGTAIGLTMDVVMHVGAVSQAMAAASAMQSELGDGGNAAARLVPTRRGGHWRPVPCDQLVPGDVVSLAAADDGTGAAVPADCLVLEGTLLADEATLTGESLPQPKTAAPSRRTAGADDALDMHGEHRANVLFAGTRILEHRSAAGAALGKRAPLFDPAPGGGVPCYVLRTGAHSTRGELLSAIERLGSGVAADARETGRILAALLLAAAASSLRVLSHGSGQVAAGSRSPFKLLLQCSRVLTSVVSGSLHMSITHTVNHDLAQLNKKSGILCTSPLSLPTAGRVTHCLLDKTGTLASDELLPRGALEFAQGAGSNGTEAPAPLPDASLPTKLVIAGCHSLSAKAEYGDPLELSALSALGWTLTGDDAAESPSAGTRVERLRTFPFSAALRRMSVVANVTGPEALDAAGVYALVKGSPEAVLPLLAKSENRRAAKAIAAFAETLAPDARPPPGPDANDDDDAFFRWFDAAHAALERQGMRVLALAYKRLPDDGTTCLGAHLAEATARGIAERGLTLAGLVAYRTEIRADSAGSVAALRAGGRRVAMATGDGLLTSLHAARACRILGPARPPGAANDTAVEAAAPRATVALHVDNATGAVTWRDVDTGETRASGKKAREWAAVADDYDLCAVGEDLTRALDADKPADAAAAVDGLRHLRVIARMTPQLKERVVLGLRAREEVVLVCGDGANDVGALRAADVGVALLSGFGAANTGNASSAAPAAVATRAEEAAAAREKAKRATERARDELLAEKEKLTAGGMGDLAATFKAARTLAAREAAVRKSIALSAARDAADGDGDDGAEAAAPAVRLGDASIAAAFTAQRPSVGAALDVVRRGVATHASVLQGYQMMCLESLMAAHSLSCLYLDNVRFSVAQNIALSALVSYWTVGLTQAEPTRGPMHTARLPRSVFASWSAASLAGQCAVHVAALTAALSVAKAHALPPVAAPAAAAAAAAAAAGAVTNVRKFVPNLTSNTVFVMSALQSALITGVNYKGHPFKTPLLELTAAFLPLASCGLLAVACVLELVPLLNARLSLSVFPEGAKTALAGIMAANTAAVFLVDYCSRRAFAPKLAKLPRAPLTKQGLRNVALVGVGAVFTCSAIADEARVAGGGGLKVTPEVEDRVVAAAAAAEARPVEVTPSHWDAADGGEYRSDDAAAEDEDAAYAEDVADVDEAEDAEDDADDDGAEVAEDLADDGAVAHDLPDDEEADYADDAEDDSAEDAEDVADIDDAEDDEDAADDGTEVADVAAEDEGAVYAEDAAEDEDADYAEDAPENDATGSTSDAHEEATIRDDLEVEAEADEAEADAAAAGDSSSDSDAEPSEEGEVADLDV